MKLRHLLALPLLALATPALADPPGGLDAKIEALRKASGAPGIAVAIVEHGKTTLAKGWGYRKLGDPARVDADTIFQTGSTGKAFTAAALAILVDQGKIGWDDKVIDHMPWFRMYDPWVTREMTIRDLLVHHSGSAWAPATCCSCREAACRARRRSSAWPSSSPPPASARPTPMTTSSTWSPAS
jgi:CubicO group peptidase (beta-lactamase class C family)